MPFTSTIGKEAFKKGPTYSVKSDLDAPVVRKKEICGSLFKGFLPYC
jgi:hypothetical protein